MAYDEVLAERVRKLLQADPAYREQKMFGGLCFLLHGNMCAGVVGERLMRRVDDEAAAAALTRQHVAPMDFTGRPMRSMVYVQPEGLRAGRSRSGSIWQPTTPEGSHARVADRLPASQRLLVTRGSGSSAGRPHRSNSQGSGNPTMPEIRSSSTSSTIIP
jgi:TfoX/Sxy family transcriptional regulator of competence genes